MNRNEILSLIEVLLSVLSLWIALLLEKGVWCLLAFCSFIVLLVASMGVFKVKDKKANRVEAIMRVVAISCVVLMVIYAIYHESIYDHQNRWYYTLYLVGLAVLLLYLFFSYFTPKGWFHRRLRWMEGKVLLIKKSDNVLYAVSTDKTTIYFYPLSEQFVVISRKMFTNPLRQEKECEERRYKIRARMELARLPVEVKEISDESPFYFKTIVRIWKADATKAILRRIIDVLSEMSEDDHHLYFSIHNDKELWYIHSFRFEVVQAKTYIMRDDGAHIHNDETDNHSLKHQPEELLSQIMNVTSLDELEGFSVITYEEFEHATHIASFHSQNTSNFAAIKE